MKILHISGAKGWGGNEQQMIDLIPELTKLGVENIVFGVDESSLQYECKMKGFVFFAAKSSKLNKYVNYQYLKDLVKQVKPDIIHLHTSDSLTVYTISDMLFSLKTSAVFSKKGMGSSSSILSRFKYNYKNIKTIICVSKAVKESFSKIIYKNNINKLVVVYDGINIDRTNKENNENIRSLFNISDNKLIIGNIANHVKAKDLPTLIKAMNYLVNDKGMKNIHLVQVGGFNNKLTPELQNLISTFKLENFITLTDFQPHALDLLVQFDLYVMSSEREGLPLTIYEAFLKKTAVVSTKAGGIPEAITHGFNGYLSEVRDFEGLASNIKLLLESKNVREEFVKRSYDLFFEKFTAERSALNYFKVYQKAIQNENSIIDINL